MMKHEGGAVSYTICNSICQVRPPGGRSVVGSSGPALIGGRCQCSRYYLSVLGFVPNYTKKKKKMFFFTLAGIPQEHKLMHENQNAFREKC